VKLMTVEAARAAMLAEIKSRVLLPRSEEGEGDSNASCCRRP
jgi:chromatin segregation and condensation protein Rec8/ScpA/Scc1 (kleisin family)